MQCAYRHRSLHYTYLQKTHSNSTKTPVHPPLPTYNAPKSRNAALSLTCAVHIKAHLRFDVNFHDSSNPPCCFQHVSMHLFIAHLSTTLFLKYALNTDPCEVMSLRILCTDVHFKLDVSWLFPGCKDCLF